MLQKRNFKLVVLLIFICVTLVACNKPKDNAGNSLEIGKNYLMTNDGLKVIPFLTDIKGKEVAIGSEYIMTDSGLKLKDKLAVSKEEAIKLINIAFGLPKPVSTYINVKQNSEVGKGITSLMRNGYIISNPKFDSKTNFMADEYIGSEKGSPFIEGVDWNGYHQTFGFKGSLCNKVINEIGEILIDEDSKTAIVNFTMTYDKIEPFYSKLCINKRCRYFGQNLSKTWAQKIILKKYDKGWRIAQN